MKGEKMKKEKFADFLREVVRTAEGDEVVERLDRLVSVQKEVWKLMNNQKELPAELVNEWNNTIRELYPNGHE